MENEYSAADITVLEFRESVRRHPGMYFGIGPTHPDFPTRVLRRLIEWQLAPAPSVRAGRVLRTVADIHGPLAFTVTDDHPDLPEPGTPMGGYFDSLLARDRWLHAAIAAISTRTAVESWNHSRALRQQLDGTTPTAPARPVPARPGAGTRIAFHLDPAYLGPNAAITTDLTAFIPPDLADAKAHDIGGHITIRDHRTPSGVRLRLLSRNPRVLDPRSRQNPCRLR
ncbi:hypothetical protein [Kitasatospora sp. NPDC087314]|uniref:hypothetical protein n=1 Tax=Kitasatospora sp. NPDC087314 TaxID=3364068 RepID=UPI003807754E